MPLFDQNNANLFYLMVLLRDFLASWLQPVPPCMRVRHCFWLMLWACLIDVYAFLNITSINIIFITTSSGLVKESPNLRNDWISRKCFASKSFSKSSVYLWCILVLFLPDPLIIFAMYQTTRAHCNSVLSFSKMLIAPPSILTLHKKWGFALSIPSVNVTKFVVSCGFGHIYCRNPWWKT